MHTFPLDIIWQRDLSRPRYRGPDDTIRPFTQTKPREYGWICALLSGCPLRHHPDDHFEVMAPTPIVVIEGDKYSSAQVRRYLRRLSGPERSVGLLHIGDEFNHAPLDIYDEAAFVYRNYWRPGMESSPHCQYPPLGVNCPLNTFSPRPFSKRTHRWSFAGQIKGSREAMVEMLSDRADGVLALTDEFNSGLPKKAYARLLSDTQVVLCPRGFRAAESYRVYEALEAGAIPLVEDDGGLDLWREHTSATAAWTALTGGPSYWYDLARRSRLPSYWRSAYSSDVPFPRIYRWENVGEILDRLSSPPLARSIETWWRGYKSSLRRRLAHDIRRHLQSPSSMPMYTNGHSEAPLRH
jgi:hypothetical protein